MRRRVDRDRHRPRRIRIGTMKPSRALARASTALALLFPLTTPTATLAGAQDAGPHGIADEIRRAAALGSLADLLSSTAADMPSASSRFGEPPAPVATALAGAAIPGDLRYAIADLVAAAVEAGREVQDSIEPRWRAAAVRAIEDLLSGRDSLARLSSTSHPRLAARYREVTRHVDLRRMERSAFQIASAADRLVAMSSVHPRARVSGTAAAIAECDVEVAPYLCVGGDAANTHSGSHWVTVDLGGDDTYVGPVGAAGPCAAPGCARVAVDLAGDDVYRATAMSADCANTVCAQGAGSLAIGMLVDASGSDSYLATGAPYTAGCSYTKGRCASVRAQGVGTLGVGILADLGGADTYEVVAPQRAPGDPGDTTTTLVAQGVGETGFGLLWDAGGENDHYVATGYSTGVVKDNLSADGQSSLWVQGLAAGGAGFLVDGGGDDHFAVSVTVDQDSETMRPEAPRGEGAAIRVGAQGVDYFAFSYGNALGGLIEGEGDTTYSVAAEGRTFVLVSAQAAGTQRALLDDAGGDDSYSASLVTDMTWFAECSCEDLELKAPEGIWPMGQLTVQGHGAFSSVVGATPGVLHDRGGDDTYEAVFRSALRLVAENHLPGGAVRAVNSKAGFPVVCAQGCQSAIMDDGGDDRYVIDASVLQSAVARAAEGVPPGIRGTEDAIAQPVPLIVRGQGYVGSLSDLGGGDRYEVRIRNDATAEPDPGGRSIDGDFAAPVQGTANTYSDRGGLLIDRDGGEPDTFYQESPSVFNVCAGRYGEAPGWIGGGESYFGVAGAEGACVPGNGAVVATSTVPPAADPVVTVLSVQPVAGANPPAMAVRIRLADPSGAPLANRRIVAVASYPRNGTVGRYWRNADRTSSDLVTGADGTAAGTVPVLTPGSTFRIEAMYFGEPGEYRPAIGRSAPMQF